MINEEYREWIRSLPCSFCGRPGPSEGHHLKGFAHQSGVGLKAPDYFLMPACRECHTDVHRGGPMAREVQAEALLRTLRHAFRSGQIQFSPDAGLEF